MANQLHVVRVGDKWAVKRSGSTTPVVTKDTQQQAIEAARPIARSEKEALIIHRPDGKIGSRENFGSTMSSSKTSKR